MESITLDLRGVSASIREEIYLMAALLPRTTEDTLATIVKSTTSEKVLTAVLGHRNSYKDVVMEALLENPCEAIWRNLLAKNIKVQEELIKKAKEMFPYKSGETIQKELLTLNRNLKEKLIQRAKKSLQKAWGEEQMPIRVCWILLTEDSVPEEFLKKMLQEIEQNDMLFLEIIKQQNCSTEIIKTILKRTNNKEVWREAAISKNADDEVLDVIAKKRPTLWKKILGNPKISQETMEWILKEQSK